MTVKADFTAPTATSIRAPAPGCKLIQWAFGMMKARAATATTTWATTPALIPMPRTAAGRTAADAPTAGRGRIFSRIPRMLRPQIRVRAVIRRRSKFIETQSSRRCQPAPPDLAPASWSAAGLCRFRMEPAGTCLTKLNEMEKTAPQKAPEGWPTPKSFATTRRLRTSRSVLDCGSPLPLLHFELATQFALCHLPAMPEPRPRCLKPFRHALGSTRQNRGLDQ